MATIDLMVIHRSQVQNMTTEEKGLKPYTLSYQKGFTTHFQISAKAMEVSSVEMGRGLMKQLTSSPKAKDSSGQ